MAGNQKKSEDPKVPCNPDAERLLLGAMLVDQENALKVFAVMKGEEFFTDTNRVVFRAMQSLAGESKPIGIVELVDELNRSQTLTRAGGAAYISSLVDGMPRVVNVESYAKMVNDTYKLRRLLHFAEEVKALVDGKGEVEEVVEAAVQKLLDISATGSGGPLVRNWIDVAKAAVGQIQHDHDYPEKSARIHTGIEELDNSINGFRKKEVVVIVGPTSHGKAQPLDAMILTPSGFVRMGSIYPGETVVGVDGLRKTVTGVFPQGMKKVFRVSFSDGCSTECSEDHLWAIRDKYAKYEKRPYKVRALKDFSENLYRSSEKQRKWEIPVCCPVEFDSKQFVVDPYVMGVLIGDGGLTGNTPTVTISDDDVFSEFSSHLPFGVSPFPRQKRYEYYLTTGRRGGLNRSNPLKVELVNFGLCCKSPVKFVPEIYKMSSVFQRQSLLQGLLDADGTVSTYGKERGQAIEFCSTSERLADDVVFLVQSLGGIAHKSSRVTHFSYKGARKAGLLSWRIVICLPPSIVPFRSWKKLSRYRAPVSDPPRRAISRIEFVGEKECQCISVGSPDGLYLTDNFIVTHNTLLAQQITDYAEKQGYPGIFFSGEMPGEQVVLRQLAYDASLDFWKIRFPEKMHDEEIDALRELSKQERNVVMVENDITPMNVWALCETHKRSRDIVFAIVDYDQIIIEAGIDPNEDEEGFFRHQRRFMFQAKKIADRLDICFILLSQLRKVSHNVAKGGKPTIDDIYGDSSIRNVPHTILWVVRHFFLHDLKAEFERKATVYIIKARNGRTCKVDLTFDQNRVRLINEEPSEKNSTKDTPAPKSAAFAIDETPKETLPF